MYPTPKRIITLIVIIAVLIGALLYFVPWPTRVNLTLDAAKLDQNGNVVDNVTITINGVRLNYLFREDSLDVNIYPFDNFTWVTLSYYANKKRTGVILPHSGDCVKIHCSASDPSSEFPPFCELLFTEDFKYVAFVADRSESNIYYVASKDGAISTEALIEYFRYLPPFG